MKTLKRKYYKYKASSLYRETVIENVKTVAMIVFVIVAMALVANTAWAIILWEV